MRAQNIPIGGKINFLTILKDLGLREYSGRNRRFVSVLCECGVIKEILWEHIKSGRTKSCSCKNGALSKDRFTTHGFASGGNKRSNIYRRWSNIIQRCSNPNIGENYKYYGGRGIFVCDRWKTFSNFLEDMGEPPTPKHTIDRIDGNRGYEPGNCRWVLMEFQNRNTSRNKYVFLDGERVTFSEAARKINMPVTTFLNKMKSGTLNLKVIK